MKTRKSKKIEKMLQSASKDCSRFMSLVFAAHEAEARGQKRYAEKLRNEAKSMVTIKNAEEIKDFLLQIGDAIEM